MNTIPVISPVPVCFDPAEVAFAFAWANQLTVHRWTVFLDAADDGAEYVTVEAPGRMSNVSYHVLPIGEETQGVTATLDPWNERSPPVYQSLRAFLFALAPLTQSALVEAEAEASGFCSG